MEMTYKYGKRDYQGKMVDTVNVYLEGGVLTETALDELKAQHPGYTEVLMSSLVLFKPPEDIETELAEKNELISALGQTLRAVADELPDEQASKFPNLYHEMKYDGNLIKAGTRINWQGTLKRAAVDLWDNADSTPDAAPTLWEDIAYYMGCRIIPETITATLAFGAGEIGYWPPDGKFYRAKADGTVWTPTAYPAGWEKVTIDGDGI